MKFCAVCLLLVFCATSSVAQLPAPPRYPVAPRGAATDDVGGVQVADPYRWLENATSPETRSWASEQGSLARQYLGQLPGRRAMGELVDRLSVGETVGAPFAAGERLFYFDKTGAENQPALLVQDRPTSPARVLVDPNVFSREGLFAIVDQSASPDGRYLAYAVSTQGSSWRTVRVRDVRAGQDQPNELHEIKEGPLEWTKDNRGFFYVRTDSAHAERQRIYYHRVDRSQRDDQIVYENAEHPDWRIHANVSEDGQYLVIALTARGDTRNRMYFIDLDKPGRPNLREPIVKLFDEADAMYQFVSSRGPIFYIRTNKDAPRARVVAVDINMPDENHWTNVVRETYDPLLEAVRVDDRIIAHRLHDAHSVLELYTLMGVARGTISLPGVGTAMHLSPNTDGREMYFDYTSFLQPTTVFRYDLETRNLAPFHESRADSTLAQFETTQLFFTTKDGTRVPMFITARRGITLDGSHATLLTGAGSFGISSTPIYSPLAAAWVAHGGIFAVANVRGGGEYGPVWHDAAIGTRKHVAIDDFIAAADFLVSQRYSHAGAIGAIGNRVGGLLAAAAAMQRPDLFGAVSVDNAPLDMLHYPQFDDERSWVAEFGSPEKTPELRALLSYSPVNSVRAGAYPATLVSVEENGETIPPAHGYKWAAALQAAQTAPLPILLRVEPSTANGAGTSMAKRIALDADRVAFLADALRGK
jgi:prolyl oligopeptidase